MIRATMAAAIVAVGLAFPITGFAHARFISATPEAGSLVSTSPAEVAINYTEGVEPTFSSIEVQDASGTRVDTGNVHTATDDNRRLIVGVKTLQPGAYTVTWHVTAVDTHKTQGTFTFTVQN